jgi:hypothetical protein
LASNERDKFKPFADLKEAELTRLKSLTTVETRDVVFVGAVVEAELSQPIAKTPTSKETAIILPIRSFIL